jgi:hypothetical protein
MSLESEIVEVVNAAVASYARRCWWADASDLRQEAWVAAMEARANWNPERGPIGPYAGVAVRRAIAAYLIRESAPVSSPWHRRHELIGIRRAALDAPGVDAGTARRTWADELLQDARWQVRIIARLLQIIGEDVQLDFLVGEQRRVGRPPAWFLERLEKDRERILADEELREIWKEREA